MLQMILSGIPAFVRAGCIVRNGSQDYKHQHYNIINKKFSETFVFYQWWIAKICQGKRLSNACLSTGRHSKTVDSFTKYCQFVSCDVVISWCVHHRSRTGNYIILFLRFFKILKVNNKFKKYSNRCMLITKFICILILLNTYYLHSKKQCTQVKFDFNIFIYIYIFLILIARLFA